MVMPQVKTDVMLTNKISSSVLKKQKKKKKKKKIHQLWILQNNREQVLSLYAFLGERAHQAPWLSLLSYAPGKPVDWKLHIIAFSSFDQNQLEYQAFVAASESSLHQGH